MRRSTATLARRSTRSARRIRTSAPPIARPCRSARGGRAAARLRAHLIGRADVPARPLAAEVAALVARAAGVGRAVRQTVVADALQLRAGAARGARVRFRAGAVLRAIA